MNFRKIFKKVRVRTCVHKALTRAGTFYCKCKVGRGKLWKINWTQKFWFLFLFTPGLLSIFLNFKMSVLFFVQRILFWPNLTAFKFFSNSSFFSFSKISLFLNGHLSIYSCFLNISLLLRSTMTTRYKSDNHGQALKKQRHILLF